MYIKHIFLLIKADFFMNWEPFREKDINAKN